MSVAPGKERYKETDKKRKSKQIPNVNQDRRSGSDHQDQVGVTIFEWCVKDVELFTSKSPLSTKIAVHGSYQDQVGVTIFDLSRMLGRTICWTTYLSKFQVSKPGSSFIWYVRWILMTNHGHKKVESINK